MYSFRDQSGAKNPFFGKHHSDASKADIGKYAKSEAQKEQARNSLRIQGNRRAPYEIWIEKYGREIADAKQAELSAKHSANSTGNKNRMYGKPAPIGSGGGWSGWYKEHYFRSLLELAYLKKLLDGDVKFANGECAKYAIPYQSDGVDRSYFCDFVLVDSGQFVEIKPQRLTTTHANVVKFAAARSKHGDNFRILSEEDVGVLSTEAIATLYKSPDLKWTSKWEKRYHENFGMRVAGQRQDLPCTSPQSLP